MAVHGGLTTKNIVTHFLKKIYAFLSATHDIAERIIIQKVSFFRLHHLKQIKVKFSVFPESITTKM